MSVLDMVARTGAKLAVHGVRATLQQARATVGERVSPPVRKSVNVQAYQCATQTGMVALGSAAHVKAYGYATARRLVRVLVLSNYQDIVRLGSSRLALPEVEWSPSMSSAQVALEGTRAEIDSWVGGLGVTADATPTLPSLVRGRKATPMLPPLPPIQMPAQAQASPPDKPQSRQEQSTLVPQDEPAPPAPRAPEASQSTATEAPVAQRAVRTPQQPVTITPHEAQRAMGISARQSGSCEARGRLVYAGTVNRTLGDRSFQQFALDLIQADGSTPRVHGADLQRAVDQAGVKVGDTIEVILVGQQALARGGHKNQYGIRKLS